MRAKLIDIITSDEEIGIKHLIKYSSESNWDLNIEVKNLRVTDLSKIALTLMQTEYKDSFPECILSATAIEILVSRAKKFGLDIL